jgi:hypothetical protein
MQDQIALQNAAIRRAYAETRYRGLQEYRNLETPREESAWLVAQARSRRKVTSDPAPDAPRTIRGRIAAYFAASA